MITPGYPAASDVVDRLAEGRLGDPFLSAVSRNLATAIREWEVGTAYPSGFFAPDESSPRVYTPDPQTGVHVLDLGVGAVEIDSVTIGTQTLVANTDYILLPEDAPYSGEPWTMIKFIWRGHQERWIRGLAKSLVVIGRFGYCTQANCPVDVTESVLCRAAWLTARGMLAADGDEGGRVEASSESDMKKQWDTGGLDKRQRAFVEDLDRAWKSGLRRYQLALMV